MDAQIPMVFEIELFYDFSFFLKKLRYKKKLTEFDFRFSQPYSRILSGYTAELKT